MFLHYSQSGRSIWCTISTYSHVTISAVSYLAPVNMFVSSIVFGVCVILVLAKIKSRVETVRDGCDNHPMIFENIRSAVVELSCSHALSVVSATGALPSAFTTTHHFWYVGLNQRQE